jgi:hypothetical protein
VTNEDWEILDRLAKAGGIVGPSSREWWLNLEVEHGEELVTEIITKQRASTRQPVSVAVVDKLLKAEAQRRQNEADDAAEDAGAIPHKPADVSNLFLGERHPKQPTKAEVTRIVDRLTDGLNAAQAAVNGKRSSVSAAPDSMNAAPAAVNTERSPVHGDGGSAASATVAGDDAKRQAAAKPWGLTRPAHATTKENDMATIKQLVKSVEDEIERRGIPASAAMKEIGVSASGLNSWRKGICGADAQQKISTWLPESAKKPGAGDEGDAETPAPKAKRAKRQTPPAAGNDVIVLPSGDLIERGEDLAQRLSSFGVEPFAQTVRELIEEAAKWRKIQSALSA